MKSLVVLSALVVVAIAAPSHDNYHKKRSVGYDVVVPSAQLTYSSLYSPGAVYAPHTLVKSAVVSSPVYVGGTAVSHQSRVDVKSSPAVITEQVVQPVVASQTLVHSPVVDARSVLVSPYHAHHPAVFGVHSPTYVTGDLLIKKKRETNSL